MNIEIIIFKSKTKLNIQIRNDIDMKENTQVCMRHAENPQLSTAKTLHEPATNNYGFINGSYILCKMYS